MSGSRCRQRRSRTRARSTAASSTCPELYASERALVYGLGRAGELELHVIAGEPPDARAEHHFALEVTDLAVPRGVFEAAGHAVEDARPVDGRERFFVRDPFGNLIELVTPRA